MFKLSKKILQIVTPPLIGVFFIYLSFYYTNEEERNEIYKSLKDAKIRYILLSMFLGISSHLSRAYRWNYMLNSLGYYPKFVNNVLSIFISYLANLGIFNAFENVVTINFNHRWFGTITFIYTFSLFNTRVIKLQSHVIKCKNRSQQSQ